MQSMDDRALLRRYADEKSDDAFAALVARHVNLVYSVAMREAGNPHHAEEITQAVFIILAKKALRLRHENALSSWLFQATRLTAKNFARSELSRHRREQEAYMQSQSDKQENGLSGQSEATTESGSEIVPLLDAAVAALSEKDRRAILLRFYEGKRLQEVGQFFGANEEAAKKRVSRALEKLQRFFFKRGITSTTATLAAAMTANSLQAAPATLAKTATAMALTKGVTASASTVALTKGALKVMAWTHVHTAIAVGAVVLLAAGTTAMVVHRGQPVKVPVDLPKASWAFAGYGSPADTIETMEWASSQLNGKALLDGLSADCKEDFREYLAQNKPGMSLDEYFFKDMAPEQSHLSDISIVNTEELSPNQILVRLSFRGKSRLPNQWLKLKKFGDNWLIDDFDPKGPNGRTGLQHANAQYGGIGVALDLAPGTQTPRISKVLPALASSETNLYSGLIVEKINGTAVAGKSLSECVFMTRGRVDTDVVLELYDPGQKQTNTVELSRKHFTRTDMLFLGLR